MSLSRARRIEQCERQDWWATEGARGGWNRNAAPDTRRAFALKQLGSIAGTVGVALHDAAATYAASIRDGRRPPTYDELWSRIRTRLNAACTSRDISAWLTDPQARPMLREVFTGEWPSGRIPDDVRETTRLQVQALLRRFLAHPLTRDLHECGRGDIVVCDALDGHLVDFGEYPVKIFAAPDVVYMTGARMEIEGIAVPVPEGSPVIGDWKTGRSAGRVDAARDQLAVYAWFVQEKLGIPPGPLGYVARVADLNAPSEAEADMCWLLGAADVERGQKFIERAVGRVARWIDESGTIPMEATSKSMTACRWCPYTSLCVDRDVATVADRPVPLTLVRHSTPRGEATNGRRESTA